MDQIAEAIGDIKQCAYRVRSYMDAILRATPSYASGAQNPLEALRQAQAALEEAVEGYEGRYARDGESAALSRVQQIPVRPAPPRTTIAPSRLASWAEHGSASKPDTIVSGMPCGVRCPIGRANAVLVAQGGDAGECSDVAG